MENKDKPIFATPKPILKGDHHTGLTKREYFAAMIIQGMFANSDATKETLKQGSDPMTAFAKQAVMSADELLKQLES